MPLLGLSHCTLAPAAATLTDLVSRGGDGGAETGAGRSGGGLAVLGAARHGLASPARCMYQPCAACGVCSVRRVACCRCLVCLSRLRNGRCLDLSFPADPRILIALVTEPRLDPLAGWP